MGNVPWATGVSAGTIGTADAGACTARSGPDCQPTVTVVCIQGWMRHS